MISDSDNFLVQLKPDGTVVSTTNKENILSAINEWKDIVQVAAGRVCVIGLKKDGTVVTAGYDSYNKHNFDDWSDIVQINSIRMK